MKILLSLILLLSFKDYAQSIKPDLQDTKLWILTGRSIENSEEKNKKGIKFSEEEGTGLLLLKDFTFSNGTIEFDVKGKNVLQQSFVGIAFHIQNDSTYDAVYFRPFNFKNPDAVRRKRSVQYISVPAYDWPKLRADFPGKYENKMNPVPDPGDWFQVKVVIENNKISVFVNENSLPCLVVNKLTAVKKGKVGLWVGNTSGGSFSNLVITPQKQ
jgi:Domain of Unknown Function (DUF1080)